LKGEGDAIPRRFWEKSDFDLAQEGTLETPDLNLRSTGPPWCDLLGYIEVMRINQAIIF